MKGLSLSPLGWLPSRGGASYKPQRAPHSRVPRGGYSAVSHLPVEPRVSWMTRAEMRHTQLRLFHPRLMFAIGVLFQKNGFSNVLWLLLGVTEC